ncbi:substrate-binding periplasmic protein [Zooshikella harenae]|uniref:Transporter substrate-binding domain-containing protein n=1 Tax=Zooshikella harenae TaxID=2827238 RepID=A0ABS5ZET2_9GAMM|nr:transporter substrate-binding domain-containing protein [Zooshikella harenae]MBU2712582.1 transporter substrate-binding domain-containing protein [Zooshikella harenae]
MYNFLFKKIAIYILLFSFISLTYGQETIDFAVANWPPYFDDKVKNKGSLAQYLKNLLKNKGIDVNYVWYKSWKAAYNNSSAGRVMASPGWICNKERAKSFYFTYPIYIMEHVVFHLKSNPVKLTSIESLKNAGPIVITESYYFGREFETAAKKYKFAIRKVRLEKLSFNLLLKNRAALAPMPLDNGFIILNKYYTKEQRDKITYSPSFFKNNYYHVMVSKKYPEAIHLYETLNKILIKQSFNNKLHSDLKLHKVCPGVTQPEW